jgi:hypothetical protein
MREFREENWYKICDLVSEGGINHLVRGKVLSTRLFFILQFYGSEGWNNVHCSDSEQGPKNILLETIIFYVIRL